MKRIVAVAVALAVLGAIACGGSKVVGHYTNENGSMTLDLKPGGQASMTLLGESKPCTYTTESSQVKVQCEGDEFDFTVQDDGSLTGPPDSMMGALKKTS